MGVNGKRGFTLIELLIVVAIIGILAEFDALPGMSQDTVAERKVLIKDAPGHGCGHNLFGNLCILSLLSINRSSDFVLYFTCFTNRKNRIGK